MVDRRTFLKGAATMAMALSLPRRLRATGRSVLNDASGLNATPVHRHWTVGRDADADLIAALRAELKLAAAEKRAVAVSTARHSMGGQSLPREGLAVSLDNGRCEPSPSTMTYRVTAGTRWRHVIATLDPLGLSPAVMQSNNDFGVSGTFCVNAHGWPVAYGPFGSTVRSIDMMLADGSLVTCSRRENAELFRLAMGGYGLIGIILSLDVEMVENALLEPSYDVMPVAEFAPRFIAAATDQNASMVYGRLCVARRGFFSEALLTTYHRIPADGPLPNAHFGNLAGGVARNIYRAQTGWEQAKRWRWTVETKLRPRLSNIATRNKLLNTPVSLLESHDGSRTDILHEYFVPADRFGEFVALCQSLIPGSPQELLNITLRYVDADDMSVLAYAPGPRIAGVMAFAQERTASAEAGMRKLTEALIDGVLDLGGSFYLPYRLHARREQMAQAYPHMGEFAAAKRRLDPQLLFRNAMWDEYWG